MAPQEVIDSQGSLVDYSEETGLEVLQTILPYFPDDERMANYLCYVSSGWTRRQALSRAHASSLELEEWRKIPEFLKIDSLGYNELREQVANAYAERLVRKNTVQALEFDHTLFETVQAKIEEGMELTKDERAYFLKRTPLYGPETLNLLNKVLGKSSEEEVPTGTILDMVALVRMRQRTA